MRILSIQWLIERNVDSVTNFNLFQSTNTNRLTPNNVKTVGILVFNKLAF